LTALLLVGLILLTGCASDQANEDAFIVCQYGVAIATGGSPYRLSDSSYQRHAQEIAAAMTDVGGVRTRVALNNGVFDASYWPDGSPEQTGHVLVSRAPFSGHDVYRMSINSQPFHEVRLGGKGEARVILSVDGIDAAAFYVKTRQALKR
jgi:hypothetical protein